MGSLDRGVLAALLLAGVAHADAPNYGRVETFQPGKKYNCVPTADHKAWDCSESGQAAAPHVEAKSDAAVSTEPPASPPAAKSSELPAYLTNAAAGRRARAPAPATAVTAEPKTAVATPVPATAASPAPVSTVPPPPAAALTPVSTPPAVTPLAAAAPAPPAAEPAPSPAAAEAPPPAAIASVATGASGNREFLALPAESYIVEIAHSANRTDIAALHASLHLPLGELYELHLTRDGGDWWLLVWGHFADIDSARAARSDLPADAAVNAGWPRRIAPLQAEIRRTGE